MRVAGIDLAGNPRNDSGLCILDAEADGKVVSTRILHTDGEIIDLLLESKPVLTAVDAPLVYEGHNRECDSCLREYGALPVTLRGMEMLAVRGAGLARKFVENNIKYIEVFSTATAKILGFYSKDDFKLQKNMLALGLDGDINTRILSRDELDAILAAITGYLHLDNQTKPVGGLDGVIHVPDV
jgi:predicted nuclease with RNAse H fold